jgi:hypothetical protein
MIYTYQVSTADMRAHLKSVLELCSLHLGLQGLACLATCSPWAKKLSAKCAKLTATEQLLRTLQPAAGTAAAAAVDFAPDRSVQPQWRVKYRRHLEIEAVHWLVRVAPAEAATALAEEEVSALLVWIPAVEYWDAETLLRAGARVHYAPLLDAANSWWQEWMCGCRRSRGCAY